MIKKYKAFLERHAAAWWLLQLTWGLPMSLIGAVALLIAKLTKTGIHRYHNAIQINIPEAWGFGLELGFVFLCPIAWVEVRKHEYGHTIQNTTYGWLFPFLVGIPSAVRYWWRERQEKRGKTLPDYDAIWFEGQATRWGNIGE